MLARVFARATCPSCHTPVLCQNEENIMMSAPSGSPTTLVFWCQISSQNSKGVTPSKGVKPGWDRQSKLYFLALNVNISKTVADSVTIND